MSSFLVKGKPKKGCSGFVNGVMTMMEGKVHFIAHMARIPVFSYHPFSYHPFSYHLDTRSYHIVYMFVPHKHTFEIAQI